MSAAKNLHRMMRNIGAQTDGQASIDGIDWEDGQVSSFNITVRPNSGFFKGGTFVFTVYLGDDYPSTTAPVVRCCTDILHPNIDTCDSGEDPNDDNADNGSNICLNLFDSGVWNPKFGLETIVLGLLFLLNNPNFESPLVGIDTNTEDENDFKTMVDKYMRGEWVKGTYYDAHFFSNVEGQTDQPYCGVRRTDKAETGCDVALMNAMDSSEETSAINSSTTQIKLSRSESFQNQASLVNRPCLTKHASLMTVASLRNLIKPFALNKQCSLIKEASVTQPFGLTRHASFKEHISNLSMHPVFKIPKVDQTDCEMKLITVNDEMVLVNNFNSQELVSDFDNKAGNTCQEQGEVAMETV